jgi:hypothetical protein
MFKHSWLLLSLLASLATPAASAGETKSTRPEESGVPFAKLADSFRQAHGVEAGGDRSTLDTVLGKDYVAIQIGLFDVRYPASFVSDPKKAGDFIDSMAALFDLHDHWLAWLGSDAKSDERSDLRTVQKWVRSWKPAAVGTAFAKSDGQRDLFRVMSAGSDLVSASDRLAKRMRGSSGKAVQLILAPTRLDFLGLASFVGSLDDDSKKLLWVETLPVWTDFRLNDTQVLALEYGVVWKPGVDLSKGTDMNGRDENGLLQHVTQKATDLLLRHDLGAKVDPGLMAGLAVDMVIELFGENNARAGGSGAGNMTSQQSKFVAGGKSQGGQLARRSADTRFRESKGRDHFIPILHSCQRQGADLTAKGDKTLRGAVDCFLLTEGTANSTPFIVHAPFLNGVDAGSDVPANLRNDLLELQRAYKAAFAYWLQTKATGATGDASAILFARFLCGVSSGTDAREVYGAPLSAEAGTDSLELRFLKWLAKQS